MSFRINKGVSHESGHRRQVIQGRSLLRNGKYLKVMVELNIYSITK
jgi:hypothetical protein